MNDASYRAVWRKLEVSSETEKRLISQGNAMGKQRRSHENYNHGSGMDFFIIDRPCNHSKLQWRLLKRSNIFIIFLPGKSRRTILIVAKPSETMLFVVCN